MSDTQVSSNPAVARELTSRGVDQTTGTFRNHTVRIGNAKPVRIDKIKPDHIPFQGFRSVTRIARGTQGLDAAAVNALNVLSKSGRLDARSLLGAIRTTHEYIRRLGKLDGCAPHDALQAFAPHVENMSNSNLAKAYQMLATADADLLMTALVHEGRNNPDASDARRCAQTLFDLQALLLKEVGNRYTREVLSHEAVNHPQEASEYMAMMPMSLTRQYSPNSLSVAMPGDDDHMSATAMTALVDVAAKGATTREKSAAETSAMIARRHLGDFSPKEAGDMLRAAKLTINVNENLVAKGKSFLS
ncbi:MAG: hypothetical protein ACI4NA_06060, partial [Succinivibrio sp.]